MMQTGASITVKIMTPENSNDQNKAEVILSSHSKDEYTVYKAHALHPDEISAVSETSILIMENMSTISTDCLLHSDSAYTISPLRAFSSRNQSEASHQHITANNLNVKNNFEAMKKNTLPLTVKSHDSHLNKSDETNQELFKNLSLLHTKEITSASGSIQPVIEAISEITRNCVSSVTISETMKQDCNQNSNKAEKYIGANMQIASSHKENCDWNEPIEVSDRITPTLQMLKAEMEAMRETDLALLKQLLTISQGIQRLRRAYLMRSSRSMSLSGSSRNLQLGYRSMERQISAPLAAIYRRDSFSCRRASTADALGDSLCSLDEVDSRSQMQLDESDSSLDISYANTRSSTSATKLYHQLILSCDLTEDTEEAYEDILRRNIRLWKIGSQRQDLSEEEMVVV